MIKFKLMDRLLGYIELLKKEYPQLNDVKLSISWNSTLNDEKPKKAGTFVVFEDENDGYEIRINPLTIDFATIAVDTLPHEFAHLLQYLHNGKLNHKKRWKKYFKKNKKLFFKRIEKNS